MDNFNINIKKTDRKKTVSFQVEKGLVKILVPKNLDKTKLDNIIKSKSKWIKNKLSKVDEILPHKKKYYVSGEDFMYFGKHYKLKIIKGKKYNIKLSDKYLTIIIKSHTKDDKIKRILKNWYFESADKYLKVITSELSLKYDLNFKSVKVRNYKSRWGSCSSIGSIFYNWKIIMAPKKVIRYVVLHELAHTKIHNHSPRFWSYLKSIYEDINYPKAWLKINKNTLEM
jgi:predicted metal-dependent hydrolase